MHVKNSVCMRRVASCCPSERLLQMASISSMNMTAEIAMVNGGGILNLSKAGRPTGRVLLHCHDEQLADKSEYGCFQLTSQEEEEQMGCVALLALAKVFRNQISRGNREERGTAD